MLPGLTIADLLRLLGTGAAGHILMALGRSPLRTQHLTERIPRFAPRTVYRHAIKLAEHGLVVRQDDGRVPSVVVYSLSEGPGRELFQLLDTYTRCLAHGSGNQVETDPWTALTLLGEMWGRAWIARISEEARSSAELSDLTPDMSFHQVKRRLHLLRSRRLLDESSHRGRGKRYKLTRETRQGMALIAGIGHWRERNGLVGKQHGLTAPEMSTLLRTALPLLKLPHRPEGLIKLGAVGPASHNGGRGSGVLTVRCCRDGTLRLLTDSNAPADTWAAGTTDGWLSALVNGDHGLMRTGGKRELIDAFLAELHGTLWTGSSRAAAPV